MIQKILKQRLLESIALLMLIIASSSAVYAKPPTCFPVETLPADLRARSEELLLDALDSELLYTFIGGLKPMSLGLFNMKLPLSADAQEILKNAEEPVKGTRIIRRPTKEILGRKELLKELEELRQIVATWNCGGEIYAHVGLPTVLSNPSIKEGRYRLGIKVFHLPALAEVLTKQADYFGQYGLTPTIHPIELVNIVSKIEKDWIAYGYLYGYPQYAIDFFGATGKGQDVHRIPVFGLPNRPSSVEVWLGAVYPEMRPSGLGVGEFMWAVPKGHVQNDADRAISRQAEKILSDYSVRRAKYIGPGKPGVVKLLRDWFGERKRLKRAA